MSTINLGPFSFSSTLLVVILAIAVAMLCAWVFDRTLHTRTESMLWKVGIVTLVAGRAGFVIRYFDTYAQQPVSMLDLRDGGFSLLTAGIAAMLMTLWFAWKHAPSRKPLLLSILGGAGTLGIALTLLNVTAPPTPQISKLDLISLDGQPVPIQQFQGKPTVINLWATWCPPCRREMPALQDGQVSNPDIHFVFANQGETASIVDAYLNNEKLSLQNVLLDGDGHLAQDIKSQGLPTTLFLDAQGRVVDIRLGELSPATLQNRLNALRSSPVLTRVTKD